MKMQRVVAERIAANGTISQIVEDIDGESESVQNKEKTVRNFPRQNEGEDDMNRFTEDQDVPTLTPPTYENVTKGQQDEGEQQFCNVQNEDGSFDTVPTLTPPVYDHGRMVMRREQPVANGSDDDSDVPTLTPPTYQPTKDRR